MIEVGLHQAPIGPRWVIVLSHTDEMTPDNLARLCQQGMSRWGIKRAVLAWRMRNPENVASFPIWMPAAVADPKDILLKVASSFVRSAARRGILDQLPLQFFDGSTPVLDPAGRPIPRDVASDDLLHNSPPDPNASAPAVQNISMVMNADGTFSDETAEETKAIDQMVRRMMDEGADVDA